MESGVGARYSKTCPNFKEIRKVGGIPFGRLAGIVLSKTDNIGRDHLIHRKRSPFPYEGKALTRAKVSVSFPIELTSVRQRFARRNYRSLAPLRGAALSLLLVGRAKPCLVRKGDRSAVDEVSMDTPARHCKSCPS